MVQAEYHMDATTGMVKVTYNTGILQQCSGPAKFKIILFDKERFPFLKNSIGLIIHKL